MKNTRQIQLIYLWCFGVGKDDKILGGCVQGFALSFEKGAFKFSFTFTLSELQNRSCGYLKIKDLVFSLNF